MSVRSLVAGLFGMCLLALPTAVHAVPAPPHPFTIEQPDGSSLLVTAEGDEFGMRVETHEGYTIVRGPGGWWHFAVTGSDGSLVPSGIIPGQGNPSAVGIVRHLYPPARELARANERRAAFARSRSLHPMLAERKRLVMETAGPAAPAPGGEAAAQEASAALAPASFKLAVLLIEFPGSVTEAAVPHTYSPAQISELLFSNRTYATSPLGNPVYGSMRDYYETASYGKFQLTGQVFPWVIADNGYSYYRDTNGADTLLRQEAVAKSGVDLSQFDGYALIWAGPEAGGSGLWPHASVSEGWYMSAEKFNTFASGDLSDVGVNCHEFGHVLGLLDLYNAPYDVGQWGLMGAGSYGGCLDYSCGSRPVQFFSSDKEELGWVYPVTVGGGGGGTFSLRAWNDYPDAVKLVSQRSVFYLENRQKTGYDADLAGAGVLVFHEDFSVDPFMVDIEEADGDTGYDAGDPFPGASGNISFGCSTIPAATDVDGTCSVNVTRISVAGGTATLSAAVNWPSPGAGITVNGSGNFPNIFTAIQTATYGQSVQVPPGTFAEKVTMRPGVNLLGAGRGSSVLTDTGASYFMVVGAEDTTFSGFTLQGYFKQRSGIQVGSKGSGTTRIVNNSFVDHSVALDTSFMSSGPLAPSKGSLVVANNVFYGNQNALETVSGDDFLLLNNVFVNNMFGISQIWIGTPSYLVDYNDFYGNGTDLYQIARHDLGRHNLSSNPLFRDAAAGDYTLLAGSPCINAGNPDPAYNDLDGSRNDMGVFGGDFASAAPLSITTAFLPAGSVGVAYSRTLAATGGRTPYSWSIATGSLPSGFGLNSATGVISGTPTASGAFGFTVQVTDTRNTSAAKALSIQVNAASLPDLVVTTASGPTSGTRGKKYTFSATVKNQGAGSAGASTLTFYLSTDATITTGDIKLSDVSIPILAAEASKSVTSSVTLVTSLPTGTYYVGAIADRAGVVAEADENNNEKAGNTILVK